MNRPWQQLGWPQVAVPGGQTEEGLPLGVALIGLFAWALHEGQLAFLRSKTALVEALLLPWLTRTPRDDERVREFSDDEREAGMVEAIRHAGRQVAAAAEEDEVIAEEHGRVW